MKRMMRLIALVLCMVLLAGCGGGDVSQVGRQIKPCARFSEGEVADAMDVVESFFHKEFDGCTLRNLVYDEEATEQEALEWAVQYEAEEAIVLISSFDVGPSGGDGSLNPNSTYENWKWILIKTAFGWELKTWGYG